LRDHPDIIYFAGYPEDVSILLEQKLPSDLLILGGDALYQLGGYTKAASSSLSHLRFTAPVYPDQWEILSLSAQKPAFFKDYVRAFGDGKPGLRYGINRMDSGTMLSYDATKALLEAIKHTLEKKHPITTDNIQAELLALDAFDGVTGQISFRVNSSEDKAITVVCNKGGFFKLDAVVGRFVLNGAILTDYPATSVCA